MINWFGKSDKSDDDTGDDAPESGLGQDPRLTEESDPLSQPPTPSAGPDDGDAPAGEAQEAVEGRTHWEKAPDGTWRRQAEEGPAQRPGEEELPELASLEPIDEAEVLDLEDAGPTPEQQGDLKDALDEPPEDTEPAFGQPEPLEVEEAEPEPEWGQPEPLEAGEADPEEEHEPEWADPEPLEDHDPDAETDDPVDEPDELPAEPMAAEAPQEDEMDEESPLEEEEPAILEATADQETEGDETDQPETGPDGAPLKSDRETRQLLKTMKKQEKLRAEQEVAEAKALEEKAKEMMKKAKERRKIRSELEAHTERVKHLAPELGLDPDRPITEVPEIDEDRTTQVEFTTIQEGRSYVRVLFDTERNRYLYQVIEPQLNQTETEVLEFLQDTLVRTLEARPDLDEDEMETYLLEAIDRAILDHSILVDEVSRERLKYYIVRDFLGYGPIDVLMRDPMIEDISCDGPEVPVFLFHRQYESIRTNIVFEDDYKLDSFVIRLAQRSGKHISIAEPMLDATLPDTSRLQATLSREVTTRGSSFTIRKFRSDPLTPPDLVRLGTMSSGMAAWYWMAMEEGASLMLAGGTASGKTTSLNAVCQFIPPDRKVVSIEDTRELNLDHDNWIAGLTRAGFGGDQTESRQAGAVDMYRLLEAALRQRPEYLMVGEVRGPEAKTLFQAMATGHATYSTMHADSVKSAVYRLENPPISVPRIMLQTLDTVTIQTQARLNQRMVRRIKEVTEIVGIDPDTGDLLTNAVFKWDPRTDEHRFFGKSRTLEDIAEKNNLSLDDVMRELENRKKVVDWMVSKGIRHITEVSAVLDTYYAKPKVLLDQIDAEGEGAVEMALGEDGPSEEEMPLGDLTDNGTPASPEGMDHPAE